ncbi:MAG: tetratricopeptide repeat protein [Pseudomonadota bacterium]
MDIPFLDHDLYSEHYNELQSLYQQDLFRDLWDKATRWWGHDPWPTATLELLRARTLSNLGNDRPSDALLWRLWRKHPQLPGLAPLVAGLYRRRSPLVALRMLPVIKSRAQPNAKDQASLQREKAEILMRFRDFAAAEECLSDLEACGGDWHWVSLAGVKYAQDDYPQALIILNKTLERNPRYRPALLFKANILQLQQDLTQAIAVLADFWLISQSFWTGQLLCGFYIENQQYALAYQCLERLKTLPAVSSRDSERYLRALQADLLCAEQRYDEALNYIEQKSFFGKSIVDSIKRSVSSKTRKVLDVPFVRQANMTCAPASITAVAAYWKVNVTQADVIEAICYGGTQAVDERRWLEENGWYAQEFQLNCATAKSLIDLDVPVLLATVEPGSAHLQVLVGYDEALGTYLLRDPYYRRLQEMLIESSHEYYAASGPRAMVMAPLSYSDKIKSLNLPSAALYDCLYQLNRALNVNQREQAVAQLQQACHLDSHHRLTITCERALAFYDGDETRILAATEKLLALFPKDVNLQLSKASSLYALGSSKQMLDYLQPIVEQTNSHFLVKSRLADHLRRDHRQLVRIESLYKNLLRANPTYTENLYAYAGVLWDKGNYAESYQLYRFAACLEDTNERYTESFFKAARYHNDTEKGLNFLRDRFKRFGNKSSGPAISLFNALDSLELINEGLAILDQAIALRPDDGWIKVFAARKLLSQQQTNRALQLAELAKPLVSEVRYNELAAEIFECQLNPVAAIQCFEKILQLEPLNTKVNRSMMRVLIESGERVNADVFIAQQLARFPDNSMLLELYIDWLDKGDYQARASAYQQFIQYHPMDAWGFRGLAEALCDLDLYDAALKAAEEAIAVANNSSASHCQHGKVLLAKQQREAARQSFRKAIELSCDYTYAYPLLMQCGFNHTAQQEDLRFIYEQLMAQVSYGDGLLEYQKVAWQLLSAAEIVRFLEHALEVRPDLWHSWVALTLAYRTHGDNLRALQIIEQAAQRFPLLPRMFLELAESHTLLNQLDSAEQYYRHALQLSPGWTTPANNLCDLLERQGRYEEAIDIQKASIARSPLSSTPYGYLADLLIREQRIDEAIAALERALEVDPHYLWGWHTLYKLQNERASGQPVLNKLILVCKTFPNDGALVLAHVKLLEDDVKASTILATFLEKNPHHIDVCIQYVRYQVGLGHIDHALQFTSEAYWNNNRPLTILAAEAQIYAEKREMAQAIKSMEEVVHINSNFYDGWRYLARWYCDINAIEQAQSAIDHCVRLYPNDPGVLCYAAERLQTIDGDKDRVGNLLQRAFELNPINQYNGLTYIDYILEREEIDRAAEALALLERHQSNIYTRYRALLIHIAREESAAALDIYRSILQDKNNSDWLVQNAWEKLGKVKQGTSAASIVRELRASDQLQGSGAGYSLAEFELQQLGFKKFEQELLKKVLKDGFDKRYLEAYIRKLIDTEAQLPWKIIEKYQSLLSDDLKNWGLVGYLHVVQGRWGEAVSWFKRGSLLTQAEAGSLYFYSIALRETGQWERAASVMSDAFKREPDAYREDIVVWYALDQLLELRTAPLGELDYIRADQLASLSAYPFKLVQLLAKTKAKSFDQTHMEFAGDYLECKQTFRKVNSLSWRHARKLARRLFVSGLQQQGFARWRWLLKIASRI